MKTKQIISVKKLRLCQSFTIQHRRRVSLVKCFEKGTTKWTLVVKTSLLTLHPKMNNKTQSERKRQVNIYVRF